MQIDKYISESKYRKLKSCLVINGDRYHKFHLTSHYPIHNLSFKCKRATSEKVNKPQILPYLSWSTGPSTLANQILENPSHLPVQNLVDYYFGNTEYF